MRGPLLAGALLALATTAGRAADLLDEAARADTTLEAQVHAALVRALDGDPRGAVRDLEALDRVREARGQAASGLTDDMRLLAAGLEGRRDVRRADLHALLDADPDPVVERVARHALDEDDAAAADQLLTDDRHNRRANLVNDAIRPLGVFSGTVFLAALNPFLLAGSAVDSVATTAVNLWNYNRLSAREREALVRYRALVRRDGRTSDAADIVREVQALGAKRAAALCEDTVARGTQALDDDDLDAARYYLGRAAQLPECERRAAKPTDRLADALAKRHASADAALWPADDVVLPAGGLEAGDYQALARATVLGAPDAMMAAARRFAYSHPDSALSPGARLVVAAARDLAGRRPEAREELEDLADDDSRAGEVARGILDGPEFGQLSALAAAERRHTREVVKYVLLGGVDGRSAVYTAAQLGASGAQAAQSLGIVNVLGIATRAWQVWRRDPVSNQEIIDRGEELLARAPNGTEANDVRHRLATAYERAGNYERALLHYGSTHQPDPERVRALQGKLASKALEDAKRSTAAPLMLAAIARDFKETDAGEEARKLLEKAPPRDGVALERELLRAHPALLGPAALDLDPRLLDGDAGNGELADQGVTLAEGELRLTLRTGGTPAERVETRPLTEQQYARARAATEEALYTKLLTADRTDPETGRFERYVPVYIAGSIGESGVSLAPGIKTRPYRSPDRELYE